MTDPNRHPEEQPMTVQNPIFDMSDPLARSLFLLEAMNNNGSTDGLIEAMESDGQRRLVNSDRLPTDLNGCSQDEFEALGFTFGDSDPDDELFQPATLPEDWKREGSDHAMWSYLVDGLDRRRVSIFYKAAFYDRRAFMRTSELAEYVLDCVRENKPILHDDTWATPQRVRATLADLLGREEERAGRWRGRSEDYAAEYLAEAEADIAKYVALLAKEAPDA